MGHSGAESSLQIVARSPYVCLGDRKSRDETFQGWKVARCLCGVASVDTIRCRPVFEWHMGPVYSEWAAGV